MAWTEKMVEDLKIMWKQGLTTGEIGKRLGVSKNSIVGKVHRLQLDARPSPIKKKDGSDAKIEEQTVTPTEETPSVTEKVSKPAKTPAKPKSKPAAKTAPSPETKVAPAKEKTPEAEKTVTETKAPIAPAKTAEPAKVFVPKPAAPAKTYNGNAKLTDLDNHTCRWPIGDPKDENFHFCGRRIRMGQTYCEEHAALAYVKPTGKK